MNNNEHPNDKLTSYLIECHSSTASSKLAVKL